MTAASKIHRLFVAPRRPGTSLDVSSLIMIMITIMIMIMIMIMIVIIFVCNFIYKSSNNHNRIKY